MTSRFRGWGARLSAIGLWLVLAPAALAAAPAYTPVPGSPFSTGSDSGPESVAFDPAGGLLATADAGGEAVSVLSIDPTTDAMTQVPGSPFSTGSDSQPESVAFSPSGGLLATANTFGDGVSVFSVNHSTGALKAVPGSPFSTGSGSEPDSVAFSRNGQLLATANPFNSTVSVFSVDQSTGALHGVSGSPFPAGSSASPTSVAFSPKDGLLDVAVGTGVLVFSVDESTGKLHEVTGSPFSAGSGADPSSLAFSPSGALLATASSNGNVSVLAVNESTGALKVESGSPSPVDYGQPASIAFSPDGTQIATADTSDAIPGAVSVYAVNPSTGAATPVSGSPFMTHDGEGPFSAEFSPSGGLLAAADYGLDGVSVFSRGSTPPSVAFTVSTIGAGSDAAAAAGSVSSDPAGISCARSGGSDDLGACSASYPSGTVVTLTAAPAAGSSFAGWSGACSGTVPCSVTLGSAQSVTATFSATLAPLPSLSLSLAGSGSGTVTGSGISCPGTCSDSYPSGTSVTLTAAPAAGSSFAGWGGACSGTGACNLTMSSDQAVSATFTLLVPGAGAPPIETAPPVGTAPPVDTVPPTVTGTAQRGQALSCSTGTWTNGPTSYAYQWSRDGTPIAGATAATYTIQPGDEGLLVTCAVNASNAAGAGMTAVSDGIAVAVPVVKGCPRATGGVSKQKLGLVKLGETRAQARHAYTHSSNRGKRSEDFFCLTPIGVRVGYASGALLRTLPASQRRRLQGRVVWASTANAFYAIRGIRAGATLAAAASRLHTGAVFHVGRQDWYTARDASTTAVLKVRHGIVEEIGIATARLTKTRKAQRTFLKSFS